MINDTKVDLKEFYNSYNIDVALYNCQKEKYAAMFVPNVVDARCNGSASWDKWYSTVSLKATGKTKAGNAVVVYSHKHNYFSNPVNIKTIMDNNQLVNGAGIIPQNEFEKLVRKEDGKYVFVIDYNKVKNFESGRFPIDKALKLPQVVPFLGGREKAKTYLETLAKVKNANSILVCDYADLGNFPVGRMLFIGDFAFDGAGLIGCSLDGSGRFLGANNKVRKAKSITKSNISSLEQKL